eukprot:403346543
MLQQYQTFKDKQKGQEIRVTNVYDYKLNVDQMADKAKQDAIVEVKNEIKKILENKNNFYQMLSHKINTNRQVQEHEYDTIVRNHTVQGGAEVNKNITRNNNRFNKALSEQRSRRVIDYNDKIQGDDYAVKMQQPEPNLNLTYGQIIHNYSKKPIKTNTERLPGLLYSNLEKTVDYYDKKLQAEKFISGFGGGNQLIIQNKFNPLNKEVGVYDTLKNYDNIIKNKRYDKMLQSQDIEEMEKLSDIKQKQYIYPQNPEASPNVYNQAFQNYSSNLSKTPVSPKKILNLQPKQYINPAHNSTFQNLAREMISLQPNNKQKEPIIKDDFLNLKHPNQAGDNKSLIFVKKNRDLMKLNGNKSPQKQKSMYNHRIDVKNLKQQ